MLLFKANNNQSFRGKKEMSRKDHLANLRFFQDTSVHFCPAGRAPDGGRKPKLAPEDGDGSGVPPCLQPPSLPGQLGVLAHFTVTLKTNG